MRSALRRALPLVLVLVFSALSSASAVAKPLALGAYIPDASEDPDRIDAFAREVGHKPVIVLSYKNWSSLPFDRVELDSIWRRGAVPMITWEPWTSSGRGFPLRQIAAKRFDRYLRRAAGSARIWGKPLFVRFAHEMNGPWYPWGAGVGGNTAREFRKAWKHVVDLFRYQGATNVRWVWSPNEDSGGNLQLGSLYPGDEWVDWVGMDGFVFGGTIGWPSFTTIFGSTYERLAKLSDRPMMITETAANDEGGDKAAWIASALQREAPRFARVRALVWFDDAKPNGDFRIASSPESLRAFRRAVDSPAYAATRRTLLSTPATLSGRAVAPQAPDSGFGAPSLLERIRLKLHGKYLWLALALTVVGLLVLSAALAVLLRRSRRRRRTAAPVRS
jgi:mannan endo-1,4-beta-mannosidase